MYEFTATWQLDSELRTDYGLVSGETYEQAMNKLETFYGSGLHEVRLTSVRSEDNILIYKEEVTSLKEYFDEGF